METSNEPPQYVAERIRHALAEDERVGELDVQVRIAGSKVFLNGNVFTDERRDAITEIVSNLLPEHQVHNETYVPHVPESDDLERLS